MNRPPVQSIFITWPSSRGKGFPSCRHSLSISARPLPWLMIFCTLYKSQRTSKTGANNEFSRDVHSNTSSGGIISTIILLHGNRRLCFELEISPHLAKSTWYRADDVNFNDSVVGQQNLSMRNGRGDFSRSKRQFRKQKLKVITSIAKIVSRQRCWTEMFYNFSTEETFGQWELSIWIAEFASKAKRAATWLQSLNLIQIISNLSANCIPPHTFQILLSNIVVGVCL